MGYNKLDKHLESKRRRDKANERRSEEEEQVEEESQTNARAKSKWQQTVEVEHTRTKRKKQCIKMRYPKNENSKELYNRLVELQRKQQSAKMPVCIARVLSYEESDNDFCLIFEAVNGNTNNNATTTNEEEELITSTPNVLEYLNEYVKSSKRLKEEDIIAMVQQIIVIITTLHQHRIAHLRVDPNSFSVINKGGGGGIVVLHRLDQCRYVSDNEYYSLSQLPMIDQWWCVPPDIMMSDCHPNSFQHAQHTASKYKGMQLKAADIYHIGVLTFVMLQGYMPMSLEFIINK
ncbi:hypothetical protein RFI_12187 [Reticulomyxa filosa]|uniref:Protein kinase domain-containing protein n=1 Tax=Reticulomyxa filosa TaxID=46433 RepID=X6NHZ1_RETFI|nr:hypothetical protein RFI_12187 [Reticulomyxa filosa]|eukprot:ETO24957.1 hypothetical protein RFI_12187 [Reticulomyxa filosa]